MGTQEHKHQKEQRTEEKQVRATWQPPPSLSHPIFATHQDEHNNTNTKKNKEQKKNKYVPPGNRHPPCPTQSLQHTKMNTTTQTPKRTKNRRKTSTCHLATATLPVPPNLCNTPR